MELKHLANSFLSSSSALNGVHQPAEAFHIIPFRVQCIRSINDNHSHAYSLRFWCLFSFSFSWNCFNKIFSIVCVPSTVQVFPASVSHFNHLFVNYCIFVSSLVRREQMAAYVHTAHCHRHSIRRMLHAMHDAAPPSSPLQCAHILLFY